MVDISIYYQTEQGKEKLVVTHLVVSLDLSSKGITNIDLNQILDCKFLQRLDLSHNNLENIDLKPLAKLKSLCTLAIEQSNLDSLDIEPLGKCSNLRKLYLLGNKFSTLDIDPLGQCKYLEELSLSENHLEEIDLSPLRNCRNLSTLDLMYNRLPEIDLQPLKDCKELLELDLSMNQLKAIDLFPLLGCKQFQYLNLSDNQLIEVDITALARHREFFKFELDENTQLAIDERCFDLKPTETSPLVFSFIDQYNTRVIRTIPSVFLCHSSKDRKFVRTLAKHLQDNGIRCWIDEAEIRIGESLIDKISQAINEIDFVAAIISSISIQSEWVKKELKWAMTKEIANERVVVLPLLIDDCELPPFLIDKLYADFRKDHQKMYTTLLTSINQLFGEMIST